MELGIFFIELAGAMLAIVGFIYGAYLIYDRWFYEKIDWYPYIILCIIFGLLILGSGLVLTSALW